MKQNDLLTRDEVRGIMRDAIAAAGSAAKWCSSVGISEAYASDILKDKRAPGPKVLSALNLEAVPAYRRIAGGGAPPHA